MDSQSKKKNIWQIIWACTKCKAHERRTYNHSFNQPDLPSSRVPTNQHFTFTSVDYAGFLYFSNIHASKRTYKAWLFLMQISLTRGICLDLVASYNSPACIRGLSRFFRRRGTLSSLLSNNGTNFISVETQQFICLRSIIWNLIWCAMPWWEGVYVILMRCIKRFLKKALRRKAVTHK